MKIAAVEAIPLRIPFTATAAAGSSWAGNWAHLDTCLVKVTTDTGVVGWGDAFAYHCLEAVTAAVEHMIAPAVIGEDASDINPGDGFGGNGIGGNGFGGSDFDSPGAGEGNE